MNKKKGTVWIAALLFLFSFVYRFIGLTENHPFWVDEFASADQAKLILQYGTSLIGNDRIYIEHHNITTHLLIAGSFLLFGLQEWAARLPFAIAGSVVTVLIYFYAKQLFGRGTALGAALLNATSYFAITWSRQARGYTILQMVVITSLMLYNRLTSKHPQTFRRDSVAFSSLVIIGLLTHSMYYLFLVVLGIHFIVWNRDKLIKIKKTKIFWTVIVIATILLILFRVPAALLSFVTNNPNHVNNLWYYHSFLWREYGLITFLAIIGWAIAIQKRGMKRSFAVPYIAAHVAFLSFVFAPYVTRYLLPVIPFFYIGMSYAIMQLAGILAGWEADGFSKTLRASTALIIILFIIINGDSFTIKPKKFYSVDHVFREIALIDYDQVYDIITKGIAADNNTALIETWPARGSWYVGREYPNTYLLRWNGDGITNGISRKMEYNTNEKGEKILKGSQEVLVLDLADLKRVINSHPRGYIFIDDSSMPAEIIAYAEKNFKKELYLDHYTLDDNPYSIWPATLYSWGLE